MHHFSLLNQHFSIIFLSNYRFLNYTKKLEKKESSLVESFHTGIVFPSKCAVKVWLHSKVLFCPILKQKSISSSVYFFVKASQQLLSLLVLNGFQCDQKFYKVILFQNNHISGQFEYWIVDVALSRWYGLNRFHQIYIGPISDLIHLIDFYYIIDDWIWRGSAQIA